MKEEFRQLSDLVSGLAASVAIIGNDEQGHLAVFTCNKRFRDIFQEASPDMDAGAIAFPARLDDVAPEACRGKLATHVAQCLETRSALEFVHHCAETGMRKTWRVSLQPLLDETGEPTCVLASAQDISEKVAAERELHIANQRFAAVIEAAYDGIVSIDQDHRIILFNKAAQRLFGYTANEVIGEPIDILMPVEYRESHSRMVDGFSREVDHQRALRERSHLNARRKDGSVFPVDIAVSKINVEGTLEFTAIIRDATERLQVLENLAERANTDHLTGLLNRRAFEARGRDLFAAAKKRGEELALLLIDFDHFKKINDQYGHSVGDAVLTGAAALARSNIRDSDLFARIGGEEFVLLMPAVDAEKAMAMAERLRAAFEAGTYDQAHGTVLFTVSIGVAVGTAHTASLEDLLKDADTALYAAKQAGRNRVRLSTGNRRRPTLKAVSAD